MRLRGWAWAVASALGLWLSSADALAQGCSMCRTAVEGSDDPLAKGLSLSTLFMLSMPFAVFTTVAGWLFISHRRGSAETRGPVESPNADGAESDVASRADGPDRGE